MGFYIEKGLFQTMSWEFQYQTQPPSMHTLCYDLGREPDNRLDP